MDLSVDLEDVPGFRNLYSCGFALLFPMNLLSSSTETTPMMKKPRALYVNRDVAFF
jgi:hypothetical protein